MPSVLLPPLEFWKLPVADERGAPRAGRGRCRDRHQRRWRGAGLSRVYDGGAAEVSQVVGAMRALQKIADRRELLLGDSKTISYDNVRELTHAG